jgi:DHA2 family multidrug resistance protein
MTERVMTQDDLMPHTIGGAKLIFAIFVLALANFMAVLDITIVNVAVPHIAGGLAVSPNEGTWTITSYAVAEAIMVPLTGWLAARFGAVRVFVFAAFGFGLFSALCGIAQSLGMLIAARILQGLAGGPLMPMSQTLLMRTTPPKHANIALGLWTMTTILAPIAGPVLGGTISDTIGWQWAFYINVPVAIACGVLSLRLFAGCETERERKPVDAAGLGLLIVWIGAMQIMLDKGQEDDWFNSSFIVTLAIIGVIGFIAFLIWELTEEHPIVDLRVFRHRGFVVASLAMALTYGSYFGSVVLIPLWLQSNMNYTATLAGDIMAFNGVFGLVMAPVAAILMNRFDPRILLFVGISIISSTTLFRTTFASNIDWNHMILPQLAFGIGMPLFFVPLMGMTMASVRKEETASAAGLINFIRTTSAAISTAIVTTVWADQATADRVQLSARLNNANGALAHMQAAGQSAEQARQSLDNLVQGQSVMIATNQMFLVIGGVLALAALAVWLMPKPKGPVTAAASH